MPKVGGGRVAALEILKSTMRTREYISQGESEGKSLVDAMRDGNNEGMQEFDQVLQTMVERELISTQTALANSTNQNDLKLMLSVAAGQAPGGPGDVIALASDSDQGGV